MHERVFGSLARKSTQAVCSTHFATAERFASERLIRPGRPPSRSAQSRPSRASSTQSSDGVLMVAPVKMPLMSLPPLVSRKTFGSGHAGA